MTRFRISRTLLLVPPWIAGIQATTCSLARTGSRAFPMAAPCPRTGFRERAGGLWHYIVPLTDQPAKVPATPAGTASPAER